MDYEKLWNRQEAEQDDKSCLAFLELRHKPFEIDEDIDFTKKY